MNAKLKMFVFLIGISFFISCNIRRGTPIMVDGQVEDREWLDASSISIDNQNTLFYKSDDQYYFLAIKSDLPKPFYIDLFVASNGVCTNFHASSQLGDRVLNDTTWTDYNPETKWGYNTGWVANTVKFDRDKMQLIRDTDPESNPYAQSFISYNGFEFQFSKEQFDLNGASFRFEIRNMIGPEGFETVVFPKKSTRKLASTWLTLNF